MLAEEKNFEKLLAEKKNFEKLLAEKKTKKQHLPRSIEKILCLKTLQNSIYTDFDILTLVSPHFARIVESSCKVNPC